MHYDVRHGLRSPSLPEFKETRGGPIRDGSPQRTVLDLKKEKEEREVGPI